MILAILNKSKVVTNAEALQMTAACDLQLRRDVAPAWGMLPFEVKFYVAKPPTKALKLVIFDDADQADALGYHSDGPDGFPYGRVFVKPTMDAGAKVLTGPGSVASVLSHEVIELFLDPECNRWADGLDGNSYAFELCDPVEADGYDINKVNVSNFVLPPWFDQNPPKGSKFDFLGKLKKPFTMTKGGYVVFRAYGKEKNVFAKLNLQFGAKYPEWKKPGKAHAAARSARRNARTKTAAVRVASST